MVHFNLYSHVVIARNSICVMVSFNTGQFAVPPILIRPDWLPRKQRIERLCRHWLVRCLLGRPVTGTA